MTEPERIIRLYAKTARPIMRRYMPGTRHHKRIVAMEPLAGTRSGNTITLACGHRALAFGKLDPLGEVLCTECRDAGLPS